MMPVRKLTFQLTPLLDLLLIVFFAQYLEVRTVVREESGRLQASHLALTADLNETLQQLVLLHTQLEELQELREERQSQTRELQRMRAQRDLIGELVVEMFRLPESAVEAVVREKSPVGPGPSSADVRQLKSQLSRMAAANGTEIVDHLLTFHELRKRCDLWELYIHDDGQIVLTVGDQRLKLRAEDPAAFTARLFEAYKSMPQPKSLVLILISYGDARLGVRQAVLEGLPGALERIRLDDEGRSRYDFAVLGFRPETSAGTLP